MKAEFFVYETDGEIRGYIGIKKGYIVGIFVDRNYRFCGIDKQLLEYVKQMHNRLLLDVY